MTKRITEEKTYLICAEVHGTGGAVADIHFSMAEVTDTGDKGLSQPEQCESLTAYLTFDRMVKLFQPDYRTAVDIISELYATYTLRAMLLDNEIVFPKFPTKKWAAQVLRKYPRLIDTALQTAKKEMDVNKYPKFAPAMLDYLYGILEPEELAELFEPSMREMMKPEHCEGCKYAETGGDREYHKKKRRFRHGKNKNKS